MMANDITEDHWQEHAAQRNNCQQVDERENDG